MKQKSHLFSSNKFTRTTRSAVLLSFVFTLLACGGEAVEPEPESTVAPTPESTAAPTPESTATPAPESMATPAPESMATPAPESMATPAPEFTATPIPEFTATPIPEFTATPAPEFTATPAPESTATPAPESTATPAPESTATPAPESTATPAPESTATPTPEPTSTPTPGVETAGVELVDSTPNDFSEYLRLAKTLSNGNIVVTKPEDSMNGLTQAGSVHIYDAATQSIIASIFGDHDMDLLGAGGIHTLENGNFIILSPYDNVNGVDDAGSIKLIDGSTGVQIGDAITGVEDRDRLGLHGIYTLTNNSFAIVDGQDDSAVANDVGSIRVMSGDTGTQLSNTYYGSTAGDFEVAEITVLPNGNFAVFAPKTDNVSFENTGAVYLFNELGEQVGATFYGSNADDNLGSGTAAALSNNNFVMISPREDVGGSSSVDGTVRLIDGTTNTEIGGLITEDGVGDLSAAQILPLANNNYVLALRNDDVNGINSAGSVRLISGVDNSVIGNPITGNAIHDRVGIRGTVKILANNNYVVASPFLDVTGVANAGSVMLVNGTTGTVMGAPIVGSVESDGIGRYVEVLSNGSIAIGSPDQDVNGNIDAGSVILIDSDTGDVIGNPLIGDAGSRLGDEGLRSLSNGNFLMLSSNDSTITNANSVGAVQLVDGLTNTKINLPIGDDVLGEISLVSVAELDSGNILLIARGADVAGTENVGAVYTLDSSGELLNTPLFGEAAGDLGVVEFHEANDGSFYVLNFVFADNYGFDSAGKILLIRP